MYTTHTRVPRTRSNWFVAPLIYIRALPSLRIVQRRNHKATPQKWKSSRIQSQSQSQCLQTQNW